MAGAEVTSRRFSIRREIATRIYVASEGQPYVRIILLCGHDRVYSCVRQPKVGAMVACPTCAPKEVR